MMSKYLKSTILNRLFVDADLLSLDNMYVSLWCSNPVDSFGNLKDHGEVTPPSYGRVPIPYQVGSFTEVLGEDVRNNIEITFDEAQEDWGVVTYVALFDSEEGGELLFSHKLNTSREVVVGDIVKFPVSSLRIRFV